MEEKELLEIEAREIEQAKKNVNEMAQRNRAADVHLLYKDKFDLENKKACHPVVDELLPILISLYEKSLFNVRPYASPEEFSQITGFSVNQLIEWRNRGWVETVLTLPPRMYTGLSYLDELIRVSPSRGVRHHAYITMLAEGDDRINGFLDVGKILFKESVAPSSFVEAFGENKARLYCGYLAHNYVDLSALGLTKIVNMINDLARREPLNAEIICGLSTILLVVPLFDSLKKTTAYPSQLKDIASKFYETVKPMTEAFFVPCWIGDLYQNLGLTVPISMGTDEIEAMRKNNEGLIRAIKKLDEEMDKTVRKKPEGQALERDEKETITANKEEFRKRWYKDVVPGFEDIRKTEQVWSIAFTSSIISSILTLSAFRGVLDVPSAFSILTKSLLIKKLADPVAEYFVRFWERNPIHIGFYKVQKDVRKLKHKHM